MIAQGLPIYVALEPVDMRLGYERLGGVGGRPKPLSACSLLYPRNQRAQVLPPLERATLFEARRSDEFEPGDFRRRSVRSEEVSRAFHFYGLAAQHLSVRVRSGPVRHSFHQMLRDRVAQRVQHLLEHVSGVDQMGYARLLRRPQVFSSTPARVQRAQPLVKVLDENRQRASGS